MIPRMRVSVHYYSVVDAVAVSTQMWLDELPAWTKQKRESGEIALIDAVEVIAKEYIAIR